MTYIGWNNRNTLAGPTGFTGDPANTSFAGPVAYSAGTGYGYVGATSGHGENAGWVSWPMLCGTAALNQFYYVQRYDLANGAGNYKFRAALGSIGSAGAVSILIWDGICGEGSTFITSGNFTTYAASTTFTVGRYTIYGSSLYRCTASTGPTGASSPPTHTGGSAVDGGVTWLWIKTAIASVNGTTATGNAVIDATGTNYDRSAWDGSNTPAAFTSTQSYVSVTRGTAATGGLHHISFEPQATPLADLAFEDQFGNATAAPPFFAKEALGTPLFRIKASAGSIGIGNISYTGPVAQYLDTQIINGQTWCVVGATRIPDDAAGVIGVKQTDNSATISGSPRTTTITPVITSSGGRNTSSTSIYGLIATQAAIIRQTIDGAFATELWPGYAGQAFAADIAVNSNAALATAWNNLTPDKVSWYRIRLQNGAYNGTITLNNQDFGAGGVLLEPDVGHDPYVNFLNNNTGWVANGMHWRYFRYGSSPGAGTYCMRFGTGTTYFTAVKFEKLRIGYMFADGNPQQSDIVANVSTLFQTYHARSIEVTDCVFRGGGAIQPFNVRCCKITNNDVYQGADDYLNPGLMMDFNALTGVFADDNMYVRVKNNTLRNEIDYAGYTNASHRDFIQLRPWQAANSPYGANKTGGSAWAVGNRTFNAGKWYTVSAITTGVAGGAAPTHTSGTAVDGGVTWQYGGAFPMNRNLYMDIDTNYLHALKVLSTNSANTQFLIDNQNDYGIWPFNLYVAAYNNFETAPSGYGMKFVTPGTIVAEYNSFCGPSAPGPEASIDTSIWTVTSATSKLWARGNVIGGAPSASGLLASFGNVVASFSSGKASPAASLIGTFAANGSQWTFPVSGALTDSGQLLRRSIRSQLLAKTGLNAGCVPAPSQTLPISFDIAGAGVAGSAVQSLVLEPY